MRYYRAANDNQVVYCYRFAGLEDAHQILRA